MLSPGSPPDSVVGGVSSMAPDGLLSILLAINLFAICLLIAFFTIALLTAFFLTAFFPRLYWYDAVLFLAKPKIIYLSSVFVQRLSSSYHF